MRNEREWKEKWRKGEEGKEEERHRRKDVKAREGENLKNKINSKLVLTVVAPGDEPGGKLTLH